jgi:peptide deformylase
MLQIVTYPHPILREQMPLFDFENPPIDPQLMEKEMLDTMYANGGIGLSANQVGIRARMFVMGSVLKPSQGTGFFNPEIIDADPKLVELDEGCLSFPRMFVSVKRPSSIKVRWQDYRAQWQTSTFSGYECQCFLHEFDHLEGIVFRDRVSRLKWEISRNKLKKGKH